MPTNLLSAAVCKNATSNGVGIRKVHDGDGLYLWVYLDGRKYWRMRYWQAGKEKSLSIGVYPKVSLSDARKKRDELRNQLQADLDPSAERKATNLRKKLSVENSFEAVALEWYNKQLHTWVKHHADDVKRRLESNIFPTLGKRPIDQIDALELLETIRKIEARGAYDLAHRVLQVCGQVFRYGIATGRCSRNLSTDLRGALTPHKKLHQAAVRPEELPDLLRAIAKYDEIGDKQTRLALQMLAQTFVRTNELIGAEWVEFDRDEALWIIPASRMKMKTEHIVPLSRQVLAMLAELKELSGISRFVFPGRNRDKPISNNTMLFALYRLGYKGKMTGHGFRAVASTILNETGFNPDVIERQLAHCERNEIRGAYNRAEYLAERKKMMQHWADYLDSIEAGAKVPDKIYADLFINKLCKKWPGFWNCIALDSGYTSEKVTRYLKMIILHVDIGSVVKMNNKSVLTKYISDMENFFSFASDVKDQAKLKDIITNLGIKFVYIEKPEVNEALFSFVYEEGFYEINERMIELIIRTINPSKLEGDSIRKSNYSTMLNSNCVELISHINANINEYVENVLLELEDNIDESEMAVISLLNNEDIEEKNKAAIIEKEKTFITNISDINDHELWNKIIQSSKIQATWKNLLLYFNENQVLDKAIIGFLNRQENYIALSKYKLKESEDTPEELIKLISKNMLICDELSDESYVYLIKSIPYKYRSLVGIENLPNSKVAVIISHGLLSFTEENFNVLKESFNNQYALFIEKNIADYLQNIDKYELDSVGLQRLLKSKAISVDQKMIIINAIDESIVDNEAELTRLIYEILLDQKACPELRQSLLEVLLKQNRPTLEKVRLFMCQVDHLDEAVISSMLILFGSPISGISNNQKPTIESNDTYKLFAEKLIEKGILSSFKDDSGKLRLYPKRS